MRLLCIGFDGLGYKLWKEHLSSEPLSYVEMFSPIAVSGPAWVSLYTGLPLLDHGVRDVWGRPIHSKTYADNVEQCVWTALQKRGVGCELCVLPCTWPPSEVSPYMVSGFQQQGQPWAHPPSLQLPPDFAHWTDLCWWGGFMDPGNWHHAPHQMGYAACLAKAEAGTESLTQWYIDHHDEATDFGWIAYTFPDRLFHIWWNMPEIWPRVASRVKWVIDTLREALQPQATLIVSDHGWSVAEGHTHDAILAFEGQISLGKPGGYASQGYSVYDASNIIAGVFGVPWRTSVDVDEDLEQRERLEIERRLTELGYLER